MIIFDVLRIFVDAVGVVTLVYVGVTAAAIWLGSKTERVHQQDRVND